jgi:hypothetical protein
VVLTELKPQSSLKVDRRVDVALVIELAVLVNPRLDPAQANLRSGERGDRGAVAAVLDRHVLTDGVEDA